MTAIQVFFVKYNGKAIPTANITISNTSPATNSTFWFGFTYFVNNPKTTAPKINNIEIEAAAAFGELLAPVTVNPLKVPATISVKAAITSKVNNQENRRNNFLPVLPMYFSIRTPMDFPSFFTEA